MAVLRLAFKLGYKLFTGQILPQTFHVPEAGLQWQRLQLPMPCAVRHQNLNPNLNSGLQDTNPKSNSTQNRDGNKTPPPLDPPTHLSHPSGDTCSSECTVLCCLTCTHACHSRSTSVSRQQQQLTPAVPIVVCPHIQLKKLTTQGTLPPKPSQPLRLQTPTSPCATKSMNTITLVTHAMLCCLCK